MITSIVLATDLIKVTKGSSQNYGSTTNHNEDIKNMNKAVKYWVYTVVNGSICLGS